MKNAWKRKYLQALRAQNLTKLAHATGRGYRTLHSYLRGERGIPPEAAEELARYLRDQAQTFTAAADGIEAALRKEKDER